MLKKSSFATYTTTGWLEFVKVFFIKHFLYQQRKKSVTTNKNTIHIVRLRSPRKGHQFETFGNELHLAQATLKQEMYNRATIVPFRHLLTDLSILCHEYLRFWSLICISDRYIGHRLSFYPRKQKAAAEKSQNLREQTEK